MNKKKKIQSRCQKYFQKRCWFILDKRISKAKGTMFSSKIFKDTLHCGRKHFSCYCLQAFACTA